MQIGSTGVVCSVALAPTSADICTPEKTSSEISDTSSMVQPNIQWSSPHIMETGSSISDKTLVKELPTNKLSHDYARWTATISCAQVTGTPFLAHQSHHRLNLLSKTEEDFENDRKSVMRQDKRGKRKPTGYLWRLLNANSKRVRKINLGWTDCIVVNFYDQTLQDKAGVVMSDCNHRAIGRLKAYLMHCKETNEFVDLKTFFEK